MKRGVIVRPTAPTDLDYVLAAERASGNREFVHQWSRPRHEGIIVDIAAWHWIVESAANDRRVGFVIARRDDPTARSVELKRLVITEKRRGYGRSALRFVKRWAFEEAAAHRLWLDVFEDNRAARALYESEGFVFEGVRRDHVRRDGGFISVVLMSMLEHEYRTTRQRPSGIDGAHAPPG